MMLLNLKSAVLAAVTVGSAFGVSAASAADMPVKAPPIVLVIWTWTGFYIGGNVGGAWNDTRDDVYPTGCFLTNVACGGGTANPQRSDSVRLNGSGFTGGLQAGYNWQRDRIVWGIEGDINYLGINDGSSIDRPVAAPLVGTFIHSETDKMSWLGTFRGRVGVTATPSFLLYGTGGLAFGQVKSVTAISFTTTTDAYAGALDDTKVGWTLGVGGEWIVAPKWSIKAEYLYVDLGKAGYNNACFTAVCTGFAPPPSYQTDLRVRENIVRVGLNYKIDWVQPVVAKY
jgi:outer membrane immunogenic protein